MTITEARSKAVAGGYHMHGSDGMDTDFVGGAQRVFRLDRVFRLEMRQLIDFPIGGFSPPEGRLARGCKPPAFSRFLFQSAVKSAEGF